MTPEQIRAAMRALLDERARLETEGAEIQSRAADTAQTVSEADLARAQEINVRRRQIDDDLATHQGNLTQAEADASASERAASMRAALGLSPTGSEPERRVGGARVTAEERTYSAERSRRGTASFFADAFRMRESNDPHAFERLARHARETEVEGELTERAMTTGGFAGLVVPQYLVDMYALILRTGRPVANLVQGMPLPDQGMQLIIPRGTTGATAASQATENSSVSSTDEVWANLTVPVVTIAGQQDVSRQSLERGTPGIDELIYLDLGAAYHAELDRQVLNGSGASNQMLGILGTSGINASTAYGVALTPGLFGLKTAGGIAAIAGAGTRVVPNLIVQHPRRWGWLNGQSDSTGRPLVVPGVGGPMNVLALNSSPGAYSGDGDPTSTGTVESVGSLQGLPLVTDANVPTNMGTLNEDVEIVMDRRHAILWEDGDGQPRQLRFEQTLGNQLTVKLVIYGYAAFTAGRYPVAFSKVGGADSGAGFGQIAPVF